MMPDNFPFDIGPCIPSVRRVGMFLNHSSKLFSAASLVFLFAACSPTIGPKVALDQVKFEVGVTQKNYVADTLGLPNAIEKDQQKGLEYWAYNDKTQLTGLILPVVTGNSVGTYSADTINVPFFSPGKVQSAALICVFDSRNVLVNLQKLK